MARFGSMSGFAQMCRVLESRIRDRVWLTLGHLLDIPLPAVTRDHLVVATKTAIVSIAGRRRCIARFIEEQRTGDGAETEALVHDEQGRHLLGALLVPMELQSRTKKGR